MMDHSSDLPSGAQKLESQEVPPSRKVYTKPELQVFGDIRGMTLAPSPRPQFESGRGFGWRSRIGP